VVAQRGKDSRSTEPTSTGRGVGVSKENACPCEKKKRGMSALEGEEKKTVINHRREKEERKDL